MASATSRSSAGNRPLTEAIDRLVARDHAQPGDRAGFRGIEPRRFLPHGGIGVLERILGVLLAAKQPQADAVQLGRGALIERRQRGPLAPRDPVEQANQLAAVARRIRGHHWAIHPDRGVSPKSWPAGGERPNDRHARSPAVPRPGDTAARAERMQIGDKCIRRATRAVSAPMTRAQRKHNGPALVRPGASF